VNLKPNTLYICKVEGVDVEQLLKTDENCTFQITSDDQKYMMFEKILEWREFKFRYFFSGDCCE